MIDKIYLISIGIITVILLYLYFAYEQDYRREMDRIERLEEKRVRHERELDYLRSLSTPCPIPGLNSPRQCYIDSGYKCVWNELADRCDKKE